MTYYRVVVLDEPSGSVDFRQEVNEEGSVDWTSAQFESWAVPRRIGVAKILPSAPGGQARN